MAIMAEPKERTEEKPPDAESGATKARPEKREDEEVGGPKGLEPTRYGDWEQKGRCIDF
jgi:hypothetical protein